MSATTFAGLLLIAVPLAFNGAFAALASRFDYPDVLRAHRGGDGAARRARRGDRPRARLVLARFRRSGLAVH
jgi:hypothetical protein